MAAGSRGSQERDRATPASRRGAHLAAPMGGVEREAAVDGTSAAHQPHATDAGVGQPGAVAYGRVGLVLPPGVAYDRWEEIGRTLWAMEWARLWWLGDWLLYGEQAYGERQAQAEALAGYDYATLSGARWVCSRIPVEGRQPTLSFAHHREVAGLAPAEQARWLAEAERAGWSVQELRAGLRGRWTPLDELRHGWARATAQERAAFLAEVRRPAR